MVFRWYFLGYHHRCSAEHHVVFVWLVKLKNNFFFDFFDIKQQRYGYWAVKYCLEDTLLGMISSWQERERETLRIWQIAKKDSILNFISIQINFVYWLVLRPYCAVALKWMINEISFIEQAHKSKCKWQHVNGALYGANFSLNGDDVEKMAVFANGDGDGVCVLFVGKMQIWIISLVWGAWCKTFVLHPL